MRAAVELGQALGVQVIAEGIEHHTQLNTLRDLCCPLGQGFLFAKPLPLADAQRLMQTSTGDTPPDSASKRTTSRQAPNRAAA